MKMNKIVIIPQGEQTRYSVESNRWNFTLEDNNFVIEILYGLTGKKTIIEKKDVEDGVFTFDTTDMIGQLTARMVMDIIDPDCPDNVRKEVDEQIIGFVSTLPCTRLQDCPACKGEHDIIYTYLNA